MATADERFADLEIRMSEQTFGMKDLSVQMSALGDRLTQQIQAFRRQAESADPIRR